MRKLATLVFTLAVASILATPAPAHAAVKATPVQVLTSSVATFLPGQQAWVSVLVQGGNVSSCDVRVTAVVGAAGVSYPENTATFTAPYRDEELMAYEIDYVAINIKVPATMKGVQSAALTVSYDTCGAKNNGSDNGNGNKVGHEGQEIVEALSTNVPVIPALLPSLSQTTLLVGPVKHGTSQWVNVGYSGTLPDMTNFRFQITDAAGAIVTYPSGKTDSGLVLGADLMPLRADTAAVNIDATKLNPGIYFLKTKATYGASRATTTGTITLTVV